MIDKSVLNFDYNQLVDWLDKDAGCSNPSYFGATKSGGLKLQQNPREYASLLLLMKSHGAKSYLELGIGNGGSFAMACFMMQDTLSSCNAVDCLDPEYKRIGQCEEEINSFVGYVNSLNRVEISGWRFASRLHAMFFNTTTDEFFANLHENVLYDIIFIDADHSYEGVRKDFVNAQKHINENGLIIFHDIASKACPGIVKIWNDIKKEVPESCTEFIHGENCGIGVLRC